jgi:hypothetical protein
MFTADPPPAATALTRAQLLGYRAAVHHLQRPTGDPMGEGVLLAGVQDYPPGRTAGARREGESDGPPVEATFAP